MKKRLVGLAMMVGLLSGCEMGDFIEGSQDFTGANPVDFAETLDQLRDKTLTGPSTEGEGAASNGDDSKDEQTTTYEYYPTKPKGKLYPAKVIGIIDGDTITIDEVVIGNAENEEHIILKDQKIRLIGVDAPEISTNGDYSKPERFGTEATNFTSSHLLNRTVYLEVKEDALYDPYDRLLAHIWLDEGNLLGNFNALLLHEGYASIMSIAPHTTYASIFKGIEQQAKQDGVGMWGE
ncbi:thermonuclease family protein (plasmid) [Alkalihalophilus sp. As8PL]|uniref:Thermonuclease family protein n=1 Tax=Alkalihalophilus sp. As8PL TaxID=3237103 RepID=A0AB39BN79_9BACI